MGWGCRYVQSNALRDKTGPTGHMGRAPCGAGRSVTFLIPGASVPPPCFLSALRHAVMNVDERLAILVPIFSELLCSASQDNDTLPSLLPKTKGAEAAPAPAPAPDLRPPAPNSCEFICFSSSGIMRPTCDARRRVDPPVACFRSLLTGRLAFGEARAAEDTEPGVGSGNMILSARVCPATTGDISSLALPRRELDPPAPIVR